MHVAQKNPKVPPCLLRTLRSWDFSYFRSSHPAPTGIIKQLNFKLTT